MNINKSILLIDPAFDPSQATACILLVKIGLDSFSYAIVNQSTQQVIALYDEQECSNSPLKLTERFHTNLYLNLPYMETKIAIYCEDEISIPNDLFDENSVKLHSKLIKSKAIVNLFVQDHFNFTTVIGLSKPIQAIFNKQNNFKIYPQYAGLLAMAENSKNSILYLDFSANSFTTLYIKNQQVVFQKSFDTVNAEELNYFLLLIIKQLSIDVDVVEIQLSGIIHQDDTKYHCLKKYFTVIHLNKVSAELNIEIIKDMPIHYYTNLLALIQCV